MTGTATTYGAQDAIREIAGLELEDAFIKVSFEEESNNSGDKDKLYGDWVENSSGKRSAPEIFGADALRKLFPKHSLVMSSDYSLNLLQFPAAYTKALSPSELITNAVYVPFARKLGGVPGVLAESVEFGSFTLAWDKYDFIVYIAKWPVGFGIRNQHFVLHEGPEEPAKALLVAAGAWSQELHDEIYVFNQGFWRKNHALWMEVQKANWEDVILKHEFKAALQKDVNSFFKSQDIYKKLAVPWKRGLIMYGPPGNGKTISIKAIMKTIQEQGHVPLYVKSFQSYAGEEASMATVFEKARQMAPCIIVLEDLDSLINDKNRSFFLNQLDGLEGNDGLLVIGSTNHFERLDPGLSSRPSRFDRKYLFDDPDTDERMLYCKYWQQKLSDNDQINFPDSLVKEVAELSKGFSFAYLKEAFVSTLVLLATEKKEGEFERSLRDQIKELRKQLDKDPRSDAQRISGNTTASAASAPLLPPGPRSDRWHSTRQVALAAAATSLGRSFLY